VCRDPITHSFGEGYATRADEEGFGTVYARADDEERPGHPGSGTLLISAVQSTTRLREAR
jgi:hypothetical protein